MPISFKNSSLFALTLALASCGHPHEGHHPEPRPDQDHDAHEAHAASNPAALGLILNGSERWEMDEHTRTTFTKMAQRLEGSDLQAAPATELTETGALLRKDIDDLIAGCTMVGEAHNALHKYLAAYMPAVDALSQQGSLESAERVHALLGIYPEFFE